MKFEALLLAATAATALASVALAQTTSTTTSRTAAPSAAMAPTAQTMPQTAPTQTTPTQTTPSTMGNTTSMGASSGMNTTGAATMPSASGPFRPLQPNPSQDIVSLLKASGEFNTFLGIADATSLTQVLQTTPGITVFAPTDAAFAALPPAALDLKDPVNLQKLQKLLTYHIVNTKVPPLAGHSATPVTTVAGSKVTLDGLGPSVKINDATALQTQVMASNGGVYPIDKVLSPDYVPPPAAEPEATPATNTTEQTTTTTKKKTSRKHHTS